MSTQQKKQFNNIFAPMFNSKRRPSTSNQHKDSSSDLDTDENCACNSANSDNNSSDSGSMGRRRWSNSSNQSNSSNGRYEKQNHNHTRNGQIGHSPSNNSYGYESSQDRGRIDSNSHYSNSNNSNDRKSGFFNNKRNHQVTGSRYQNQNQSYGQINPNNSFKPALLPLDSNSRPNHSIGQGRNDRNRSKSPYQQGAKQQHYGNTPRSYNNNKRNWNSNGNGHPNYQQTQNNNGYHGHYKDSNWNEKQDNYYSKQKYSSARSNKCHNNTYQKSFISSDSGQDSMMDSDNHQGGHGFKTQGFYGKSVESDYTSDILCTDIDEKMDIDRDDVETNPISSQQDKFDKFEELSLTSPYLSELPVSPPPAHLLASKWTMYYRVNKAKSAEWKDLETTQLASVYSIESFWQILNHLITPSKMKKRIGPNLMFFRESIKPAWEDEKNQGGGMWGIILRDPKQRFQLLDKIWFESLLACVGETLTFGELVNGVVIQRRQKEDRIQLWTREAANQDIQYSIGQHYKSLLNLDDSVEICYTKHADMQYITGNNSGVATARVSRRESTVTVSQNNGPLTNITVNELSESDPAPTAIINGQMDTNEDEPETDSRSIDPIKRRISFPTTSLNQINENDVQGRISGSRPQLKKGNKSFEAYKDMSYSNMLEQLDRLRI